MLKNQENLNSSNFHLIGSDNNLYFDVKITGEKPVLNYCSQCLIADACFGEKGQRYGKARVNLNTPIIRNITNDDLSKIPCGAGIEIIERE